MFVGLQGERVGVKGSILTFMKEVDGYCPKQIKDWPYECLAWKDKDMYRERHAEKL